MHSRVVQICIGSGTLMGSACRTSTCAGAATVCTQLQRCCDTVSKQAGACKPGRACGVATSGERMRVLRQTGADEATACRGQTEELVSTARHNKHLCIVFRCLKLSPSACGRSVHACTAVLLLSGFSFPHPEARNGPPCSQKPPATLCAAFI